MRLHSTFTFCALDALVLREMYNTCFVKNLVVSFVNSTDFLSHNLLTYFGNAILQILPMNRFKVFKPSLPYYGFHIIHLRHSGQLKLFRTQNVILLYHLMKHFFKEFIKIVPIRYFIDYFLSNFSFSYFLS